MSCTGGTYKPTLDSDTCRADENGFHFRAVYAGEPFKKLFDGRAVLEIVEEGGDGHTRSQEDPRATELIRVSFYGWALLPVCHCSVSPKSALTVVYHERL